MSSEVKLTVQSDVDVNPQNGTFNLNFANGYLQGKKELFLFKNDEFMINSFRVNIDTDDINHTTYNNPDGLQVDLGEGEIKYVLQNMENSRARLENEEKAERDRRLSGLEKSPRVETNHPLPNNFPREL